MTTEQNNPGANATQWLDGKITMGKMLQLEGLTYTQGCDLVGGIWQALREKAYAIDAELDRKIKLAKEFRALAEKGDTDRTVKTDIHDEAIRAHAFEEARSLLRFHLLGCIDRTGAGA